MTTEGDYYGLELNYNDCKKKLKEAEATIKNTNIAHIREISDLQKELVEAKAKFRNLSSMYFRAKDEISVLKKELDEVVEARTLTVEIPESWGWSDCFFCSEPIKEDANYDTFMSKPIHKECREKLIDGLNASYREKEKKENES